MVGLPKGTAFLRITAVTSAGARYGMSRSFHLCVPSRAGRAGASQYLQRI
jgi:hypothetical protein